MAPKCVCGGSRPKTDTGHYAALCAACGARSRMLEAQIEYQLAQAYETEDPCPTCYGQGGQRVTQTLSDGGTILATGRCDVCKGTKKATSAATKR